MGNTMPVDNSSSSDDDDYTDPSVLFTNSRMRHTSDMQVDAVDGDRFSQLNNRIRNLILSSEKIEEVESYLDIYEKISLIFLLYDDNRMALDQTKQIYQMTQSAFLHNWLMNEPVVGSRNKKMIEALAVIQNFQAVECLGFNKNEIISNFLSDQPLHSVSVDKARKYIYYIFEQISQDDADLLLANINEELKNQNTSFERHQHLEMNYLEYLKIGYLKKNDFSNLLKHLKLMDYDNIYEDLKRMNEKCLSDRRKIETDKVSVSSASSMYDDNASSCTSYYENTSAIYEEDQIYVIDEKHPGVCLIIENETFYTEPNEKFLDLRLTDTGAKITTRYGTHHDSQRLKSIFEKMGYHVEYEKDKTHLEMMDVINKVINEIDEKASSFFLCILSHGIEGKIIACNSIPVEVEEIKKLITTIKLEGKPKVLILQSCQGREIQQINSDLTTDGISCLRTVRTVPITADILELWSTVPGYASIRSASEGSWLIQSFCDVVEKYPQRHMLDLCTLVKNKVRQKKWEDHGVTKVMDCQTKETFSKFFFLPALNRQIL